MSEQTRPKYALGHEENRRKVCAPCGKKITVKTIRSTTPKNVELIVRFINPDFDVENPCYPSGLCETCRKYLSVADKTGDISKLPKMLNYEDMYLLRATRADEKTCSCNICLTAKSQRQNKRINSDCIERDTGLIASDDVDKLPNKEVVKKIKTTVDICIKCKQEIGKGRNHRCTDAQASGNLVSHIKTIPTKQQEQVTTSMIKSQIQEQGSLNNTVTLSTKGLKARVTLNPSLSTHVVKFSHEALNNLQTYLNNISNKHMKNIAKWLRVHGGRDSVEPGYANTVTKVGQKLADLYKLEYHNFEGKEGIKVKRPVVYADAEELVATVTDARGYLGVVFVKVMADGGQGFLKICVTVLPENYNPDLDRASTEEDDELVAELDGNQGSSGKRSTYKEGGGIGTFKLTSVKRLLIIAVVPDCKETHANMSILFDITKLNRISFLFVADGKLLLICLGCQTSSASYPCPYCLIPLREITASVDVTGEDLTEDLWEERTFGKLEASHNIYTTIYDSDRKLAKNCFSTVEASLLEEDADVRVLYKCPTEELHEMLGFVNHTYWDGYVKVVGGRTQALKFPQKINAVAKEYHGVQFEGKACRDMLKQAHKMLDKDVLGDTCPILVQPYVRAYQAMDKLVDHCFGTKLVDQDKAVDQLKELVVAYMGLEISVTPKMHVLFYHLLPSLLNPVLQGRGLGVVSGQAGESIHQEFKIFWAKYKINSMDSPLYGDHLLHAVVEFSSKHL